MQLNSHGSRGLLLFALVSILWICAGPSAVAQRNSLGAGAFGSANVSPISLEAVIVAAQGDQPAILVVTAIIEEGYKTYSITQLPGGPVQTKIKRDASDQYEIGEFQSIEKPKIHPEPVFNDLLVEEHTGSVSWYAPLRLAPGVVADSLEIKGKVFAQACNKTGCLPPKDHPFVARLGASAVPLPKVKPVDPANISEPTAQAPTESSVSPIVNTPRTNYEIGQLIPQSKDSASSSLLLMIGAAMLAGFILNFMPCVLPVIGLKLLSFLEQGGKNPRRVLMLNVWYTLGILSVFWALAGITIVLRLWFGQSFGWGQQYSYDGFNIALISIVFVMALSFLGVWEIPIPGFAGTRNAHEMASREGALGAFIKGTITTLLATPCSGPFLGTAVGFALGSAPIITFTIFTCMGLGMAAPYLFIGFQPNLMRFLPKPGAWMDTFKQVMGFVLIGTVLWLMMPVDAHLLMPTLILLAGLSVACWRIGRTPAYAERKDKLKAWGQGTIFAAIVGWLAFAMPQVTDPLPWQKFTMAQFVDDVNSNKTVLVEFTAEWCATCKFLKAANLDRSKTKAVVSSNDVAVYEADFDRISEEEREFFFKMQPSGGVPLVAVFPAGNKYAPVCFGNGYTQSQILEALNAAGPSKKANQD
jgi:thiol:disulfide interchange protein